MTKASTVIFAWVCHLLILLHFDTRSRCEAASISCQNERECANGTYTNLIGSDQSIECDGYRSCMNLDSISIDQDPDPSSYFITCRGSLSCYKTSNIYTFKSASIQCYGLQSCSFVENITIISSSNAGVIYGYGELSLYKSKIYDTGTLLCYGDYACSNIYTNGVKYIWGKGRMSMSNSIFVNNIDNGLTAFYFIGYLAGYNSTIYCNYQCDIQCYGNGCIGLNIICNDTNTDFYLCTLDCNNAGTNDNITNSNDYSCPTIYYTSENDITTIESSIATTIAQISSIYNNELTIPIFDVFSDSDSISICNSDVSTSYLCGDYEECLSANILTSNSNDKDICCSARFGCNVATRIENDNFISASDINRIRCDGHGACRDVINSISIATIPSSMDIIGKIYCSAMSSCEYSDMYIESSNNNNYDNGNGNVIYCSAYSSCQFSSIINGDSNMEIHCSSYISCWHMTIRGIKNIYVTGQNAMTGAKIYSDNRNITMNLYLSSYNAGTGNPDTFMVYCNEDDICNIYCQTDYACQGMIVYCVALLPGITNCNIDCDDSSISSNCPTVNITSKLFNQTTGNPTTAIPTATPSAVPTYAPTITTTIGMHATTMSPTINTPGNTNNTNNNNNNNNSNNNNNTSTYTSNNNDNNSTSSASANTNTNTNTKTIDTFTTTKYMNDTGGNIGETNDNGENNDGSDNNNGDNNQSDQISLFIVIAVSSGVTIFLIICVLLIGFCLYRKHQKNKKHESRGSTNTDNSTMNDVSNNTLASDIAMVTPKGITNGDDATAELETNQIVNSNVHAELEPGQVPQGQGQGQAPQNRKSNDSEEHDHSTSSLLYPQSNDVPIATSDAIQGEAKNTEIDSDQMMAMKLQMEMLMGIDANTTTTGGGGNGVTHGMQIRHNNVASNSNSNDYDSAVNLADSFANEYNKTKEENEQLENEIYGNGKRNNGRYQTPTHGAIHHYHRTPHGHGTRGGQAGGDGHGNGNMRMPPLALHGNLKYQLSNNSNDSYEYDNNNENNENKGNNGEQNGEDDRRVSSVEGQIKQRG